MTGNAITVLKFILAWGWRFLTGYYIPGTNVTPGAFLFMLIFTSFVINFFRRLFNVAESGTKSTHKKESSGD